LIEYCVGSNKNSCETVTTVGEPSFVELIMSRPTWSACTRMQQLTGAWHRHGCNLAIQWLVVDDDLGGWSYLACRRV
jgi:hypothetical protein